jgi:hypothetical protein
MPLFDDAKEFFRRKGQATVKEEEVPAAQPAEETAN